LKVVYIVFKGSHLVDKRRQHKKSHEVMRVGPISYGIFYTFTSSWTSLKRKL